VKWCWKSMIIRGSYRFGRGVLAHVVAPVIGIAAKRQA
jgi:hypothetical protein